MTHPELLEILRSLRDGLAQLLGNRLETVYLYGSQARGDASADSDIDVLVVLNGDFDYFDMIEKTGALAADLSLHYETVIALAFISKQNYEHGRVPFLVNVQQEGITL
jgi:predicted nucleotidyltransferase